jgi:hypothetical protein
MIPTSQKLPVQFLCNSVTPESPIVGCARARRDWLNICTGRTTLKNF